MGLKLGRASLRMTCASPDRSSLVWIAPSLLRDLRQDYRAPAEDTLWRLEQRTFWRPLRSQLTPYRSCTQLRCKPTQQAHFQISRGQTWDTPRPSIADNYSRSHCLGGATS